MGRTSVRTKTVYSCTECGATAPKWQGQCAHCSAWNTLVETAVEASAGKVGTPVDSLLLYCYHYDPMTGRSATPTNGSRTNRRDRAIRLANELCDLVQVRSGQDGTTVRIHTRRSPEPTRDARSRRR